MLQFSDLNHHIYDYVYKKADYKMSLNINETQIYRICLKSLDRHYKLITFEYTLSDEN